MVPKLNTLSNDRGSIMVVALLLLVFLTVIGITATSNTRMELNMTRNSQEYKRDFYVADSGWRAAAVNLQAFDWDYPDYAGGVKAYGNPDGTLNNINYAYRIEHVAGAGSVTTVGAAGNSGAMGCRDEVFEVNSRALDANGNPTQEINTRLVKVCCGSY
jgi:Tfp pilus assembly protein PilX